jgi:hypothetical protein
MECHQMGSCFVVRESRGVQCASTTSLVACQIKNPVGLVQFPNRAVSYSDSFVFGKNYLNFD